MALTNLWSRRWLRALAACLVAWIVLVALPSFRSVRALLVAPLCVHAPEASGELAYVMADGDAYLERLLAASDLYHMHRTQAIYILDEQAGANFDYVAGRSQTKVESAINYLRFLGVPREAIRCVEEPQPAWMSSLSEAEAVSRILPKNAQRVVVVTSAPHTRRSLLCFARSLPREVKAIPYAASPSVASAEIYWPIWHEYLKLFIYYLFA